MSLAKIVPAARNISASAIKLVKRAGTDPEFGYKLQSVASHLFVNLADNPANLRWTAQWLASMLPGRNPLTEEVPWITFEAREWLGEYLEPHMRVFEFGSGGSTMFIARRVQSVVSLEHHPDYYDFVSTILEQQDIDNVTYFLRKPEEIDEDENIPYGPGSFTSRSEGSLGMSFESYVRTIDDYPNEHFDLVVVDGRSRVSCIARALPKIRRGGVLLLDNAEREDYRSGIELLSDFEVREFFGIGPCNSHQWLTSAYKKP